MMHDGIVAGFGTGMEMPALHEKRIERKDINIP